MKEIEILYSLSEDIVTARSKIENFSLENDPFKFLKEKNVVDTYFSSHYFNDLSPDLNCRLSSSLRIREIDGVNYITYKIDKFDGSNVWLYSDEFETEIGDPEIMKRILNNLHLTELIKIDNTKIIYENSKYELVLEDVKGLGSFVEIEYKSDVDIDENNVEKIKQSIRELISKINLSVKQELNAGKPELMLKKKIL